jgi:hypothetical protein
MVEELLASYTVKGEWVIIYSSGIFSLSEGHEIK